jgi:hypothetical protein
MSWEELAAKKIHHLGGRPDEKYFTVAEMQLATQIAAQADLLAKTLPTKEKSYNAADPYSTSSDSATVSASASAPKEQ